MCKIYVGKRKLMHYYLIITIIIEYAWMCVNKQDSEYADGPKYAKILNMAKFWTGKVLNMRALHNVLNMPEYVLLDRILNISWVLNMPIFWI